jgi:hypothetical protein
LNGFQQQRVDIGSPSPPMGHQIAARRFDAAEFRRLFAGFAVVLFRMLNREQNQFAN